MSTPRIVCVLGMHRTGTSVLARALAAIGVELGEDLIGPRDDNPKGFFEDLEVVRVNEELLGRLNRNWASIGVLGSGEQTSRSHDETFQRAVEILKERTSRFALWGFKDPRTALLLPFWQKAFKSLGLSVAYIISLRNPIGVGRSLHSRNDFPSAWSQIMWLQHYCSAFRYTKGKPRLVVDYDLLMSHPRAQLRRIATLIGRSFDGSLDNELQEYCGEFLDPMLCHSRFPTERLREIPALVPHLADFFEWASGLANDHAQENGMETSLLNGVNRNFQSCSVLLELLDDLKRRNDILVDQLAVAKSNAREKHRLRNLILLSPSLAWKRIRSW